MEDKYDRKINYMRLSVTDLCNYRCHYCMPEKGIVKCPHKDILSIEEFEEIAKVGSELGINKIRITGGEPLVRKNIVELVRKISRIEGIEDIAMTTNGSLLEKYAKDLKEAGLMRLNISLDTLKADTFKKVTRGGNLEDALGGIKAAIDAGFTSIKINAVLMGGINDMEIKDFEEFAKKHDLTVRFIELMPMGECASWDKEKFVKAEKVLEVLPDLIPIKNDGVSELYKIKGGRGKIGLIRPFGNRFCAYCNRIRITSDGMLKPCLHSEREIPIKGLKGEKLREVLSEGIMSKPRQHEMIEKGISSAARNMNTIGG